MLESNYPKKLMKEINKKNKLFDDQLIECAKNNFKKGQEQERKRILEIIDKLREVRGNDNSLILITFGNDFSTNSVEMMRTKLKQQIEGEK